MKCFIISPIGKPDGEIRAHADDVYDCIIRPALEQAGVRGHRADHVKDVGRITHQMYEDILTSDFCIALLHGFNPNVFYELAVAHSAGVPVILLSQKATDTPFDIKDERVFHYDLAPRAIFRGDNIGALVTMIESVRRLEGRREVPFGRNLVPLSATAARAPFVLSGETNASANFWTDIVGGVGQRLHMAGIGFTGWKGMPGVREVLQERAAAGCDIRILTMDTENPALWTMMNREVTGIARSASSDLADTRAWFKTVLGDRPNAAVRALRNGSLFQQIIIADDRALISPYLYSANTGYSPRLEIDTASSAFNAFAREFETLWNLNAAE